MIELDLEDAERIILRDVLASYDTDRKDFRDMLKDRKAVIEKVLNSIDPAAESKR